MTRLSDQGFKWINTEFGHYKYLYVLLLEGVSSDDDEEVASIVKIKTKKEKIVIEAKSDRLGFKVEQEFDDPKLASKFVTITKKWIGDEILKIENAKLEEMKKG